MHRWLLAAGCVAMALAVAGGAYSAHAAKHAVHPEAERLLQTAVLYMLVNSPGLAIAGVLARTAPSRWLAAAGALHLAGIVLFCGSLWVLALSGKSLGVAPAGGLAFIAAWLCMAAYAVRSR